MSHGKKDELTYFLVWNELDVTVEHRISQTKKIIYLVTKTKD